MGEGRNLANTAGRSRWKRAAGSGQRVGGRKTADSHPNRGTAGMSEPATPQQDDTEATGNWKLETSCGQPSAIVDRAITR